MSEASIEKINIQINADSKKASKGLDDLITSFKKLQNYANSLGGVSAKLQSLANSVKSLSGIKLTNINSVSKSVSKLSEMVKEFNAIGDINASKVQSISKVFEAFTDAPSNRITSYLKSIRQLPKMVSEINNMPEIDKSKIQSITEAFNSFSSVGENKSGGMIRTLKQLPDIAQKINSMDMDNFTQSMKAVSNALEPLSLQADRIKGMFNGMPSSMARAISGNNSLKSSNNNLQKSFSSLTGKITIFIGKLTAIYYGANRLINVFKECFDESSSYIENLNLFNVTMGSAAKSSLEFAESVSHALGIDPSEFIKYQGVFNRMTSGFGTSSDKALLMSTNLTQLGYDIASFFNVDIETSMEKLESALAGQIKGVKEYGYNLSVAAIQETAYSLGLKENVSDMTEAQKSQLRYITLIQKSNEVMGDMGRTINTPANALRILEEQWTQLKRAIGNVISMVVVKLLPYIQAFVKLCAEGANYLAELWGFELPEIDYSSLTSGANALDDTSDGLDQISESAEETAKKISSLAGFDELNILSFGNDSSKDDKSDEKHSYDLGIDLPEYDFLEGLDSQSDEIYQKMKDGLLKVIDKFKELWGWIKKNKEFLEKLGGVLAALWATSKIKKFLGFVAGLFSPFKKLFDLIKGTSAFTKLSGWFSKTFGEGTKLGNILSVIKSVLIGIGAGIVSFFSFKDLFSELTKGTLDWKTGLLDVGVGIGAIVAAFALGGPIAGGIAIIGALAGAIDGVLESCVELRKEEEFNQFFNGEGATKLSDMSDAFIGIADEVNKVSDKYIAFGDAISEKQSNIDDAYGSVLNFKQNLQDLGSIATEEDLTNLQKAIEDMCTNVKEQLNTANKSGISLFSQAIHQASVDAKTDMQAMIDELYLLNAQGNQKIADLNKDAQETSNKMFELQKDGKQNTTEYKTLQEHLDGILKILSSFTSDAELEVDLYVEKLGDMAKATDEIDWGDSDLTDVKQYFSDITGAAEEAKEKLDKAKDSQILAMKTAKDRYDALGISYSPKLFDTWEEQINKNYEENKAKIESAIENSITPLVESAEDKLREIMGNQFSDWYTNYFSEFGERPSEEGIADQVAKIKLNVIGDFDELLSEIDTNANKLNHLYKIAVDTKMDFEGIELKTIAGTLDQKSKTIGDYTSEQIKKATDIYLDEHNLNYDDLKNLDLTDKLNLQTEIQAKLKVLYPEYGQGLRIVPYDSSTFTKGYATGGYPTTGEMFIAREAGPEMVGRIGNRTAVANNDQITSAIAQAVEAAILRAGGMFTQRQAAAASGDTYVFIDSEEIASRMERRSSSRNIRTNGRG